MERTQLMQEAVIHEAARLGVRWTAEPVREFSTSKMHGGSASVFDSHRAPIIASGL